MPEALRAKGARGDDKAFYVGSQNLYVSDFAEFGFIVDNEALAASARDTFWTPLWHYSSRAAASGREAKSCVIR